jgi:hypothetical protein
MRTNELNLPLYTFISGRVFSDRTYDTVEGMVEDIRTLHPRTTRRHACLSDITKMRKYARKMFNENKNDNITDNTEQIVVRRHIGFIAHDERYSVSGDVLTMTVHLKNRKCVGVSMHIARERCPRYGAVSGDVYMTCETLRNGRDPLRLGYTLK